MTHAICTELDNPATLKVSNIITVFWVALLNRKIVEIIAI